MVHVPKMARRLAQGNCRIMQTLCSTARFTMQMDSG
jgi:hypothetical protein